jgi:predicted PurR-regulated permease PerM
MSTQQTVADAGTEVPDRDEPSPAQESQAAEPVPAAPRVIVPRWVQLVLLPISLLALWALARAAGKVLLIFIVAAVIALILNPAVSFLQRRGLHRGLAVLSVYLAFFVSVAGIGLLLANPISNQVRSFTHDVPSIVKSANKSLADFQTYLNRHGIHVQFIKQGKTALQTLQEKVVKGSSSIVSFGGDLLTRVVSVGFDLVLIFVLSIYMLLHGQRVGRLVRRVMPDGNGTREDDYPALVQRAVAGYVRGQLLFSLIMGTTAGLALYLFGLLGIFPAGGTYAVAFGAFFGLMELVPYVGPVLGALPPVLVALFTDPISALWVALLFVGLQQLEGHVVAPQIFSHSLRTNPLLVIFALLLGLQIYGIVGALVALPILSILRETVAYLSRHLTLEPWDRTPGPLL